MPRCRWHEEFLCITFLNYSAFQGASFLQEHLNFCYKKSQKYSTARPQLFQANLSALSLWIFILLFVCWETCIPHCRNKNNSEFFMVGVLCHAFLRCYTLPTGLKATRLLNESMVMNMTGALLPRHLSNFTAIRPLSTCITWLEAAVWFNTGCFNEIWWQDFGSYCQVNKRPDKIYLHWEIWAHVTEIRKTRSCSRWTAVCNVFLLPVQVRSTCNRSKQ